MALYVNEGLNQLTKHSLGLVNNISLAIDLYVNNYLPQLTDSLALYTICTLPNYSTAALTPANWVGNAAQGLATYSYPQITWTFPNYTAPAVTIYGWVLFDLISHKLIAAEQINPSYTVPLTGGQFSLVPAWGESNC